MEIQNSKTHMLSISLDSPFKLSFGELYTLPRVIFTIRLANGITGFGEASIDFPFSSYDMFDVYHALRQVNLTGRDISERESLLAEHSGQNNLMAFPAAFTAFSMAIDDAYGKVMGKSIIDLYGRYRKGGRAMRSISIHSSNTKTFDEARRAVQDGYLPKVKVGMGVGEDIQVIQLMDKSGVEYALDFNAAYTTGTAEELLTSILRNSGLKKALYVEQPTKTGEGVKALAELVDLLRRHGNISEVVADESFVSMDDARECAKHGVSLNFKMQKIGGLHQGKMIEQGLLDAGTKLRSMVGGTFPTAIGRAYDQIAACSLQSASLHSDGLLPSTDYFTGPKNLILENFNRRGGIHIPIKGSGLGITVDTSKLAKFVVPDPEKEFSRIRNGKTSNRISISLRDGVSYGRLYEERSGRSVWWNL